MYEINKNIDKKISNLSNQKGIFACNDTQIEAAENLLSRESSTLNTLIQSVISNFTTCSKEFLVNFKANNVSEENRKKYINAYYQDRCMTFLFIFFVTFVIISFLLSLSGLDILTSVSAAATSISNVGPGLGNLIGPAYSFEEIPEFSKWVLSFGMLAGRLEFLTFLVIFQIYEKS